MDWSKSQQAVIDANDDRILVSASAGSGKTTVMIERILRLIKSGVKLGNMLICTFTRASAADMRSKLYGEMVKRGLKNELKELSCADISTIDSFCQHIVTRYFYRIGVDPQFEVLEEEAEKLLKRQAVETGLEEARKDENFARLYEILGSGRKCEALNDALLSYMNFCSINPDKKPTYSYDKLKVNAAIDDYFNELRQKAEDMIDTLDIASAQPDLKVDLLSALMTGNCKWTANTNKENAALKPALKYVRSIVESYTQKKEARAALKTQDCSEELIIAFLAAAERCSQIYVDLKNKRASVDFSDLEHMALAVLRTDAVYEIRDKYRYIFVDEYQDINPLQESIISAIAEGNKLFMVGDVKQSIYAFRGCDPGIFKAKYDSYKADKSGKTGKVIDLDTNYRSCKKVIQFVNSVFDVLMTEKFGGVDYASSPMTAHKEADGYVRMHVVNGKAISAKAQGIYSVLNEDPYSMSKSDAEAALIALRVKELLQTSDEDGPIKPSDIAILSRSMNSFEEKVAKYLKDIDISVAVSEKAYYLERPETGQLISYLRLIDNRFDDKSLAIAMLSPLGGFSEEELAEIRMSGDGAFCELAPKSDMPKAKEFFEKLDRYYRLSLVASVDELAGAIVSDAGYFNYAFSLSEDAAIVLDRFLEFLGNCPQKNSLSAVLRYLDDYNPMTELTGGDDCVNFMTVHKSKGLEFKYVFVIGLEKSFKLYKELNKSIYINDTVSMCVYDDHVEYDSDLRFAAAPEIVRKQLEEELRICYVAMTRAKAGLELFAAEADKYAMDEVYASLPEIVDFSQCKSVLEWLAPQMPFAKKHTVESISIEGAEKRKVLFAAPDRSVVEAMKDYFAFSLKPSAPAKSYVSKIAHEDDEPAAVTVPSEPTEGGALERGNAYHRAMEKLDFASPDLSILDEEDLKLIDREKILKAARAMTAFEGEIFKEQPFMLKLSARQAGVEGEGDVLVQGVIDLLFIDGDNATIIDYKTGRAHSNFEKGYFRQVELYALATERLLKKKVVKKLLYYFDSEEFVEVREIL